MHLFGWLAALDAVTAASHIVMQREAQYIIAETMMTIEMSLLNQIRLGEDLAARF